MEVSTSIGGYRSWSKLEADLPPNSCAPVASDNLEITAEGIRKMKKDFHGMLMLEAKAAAGDEDAQKFLKDNIRFQNNALRLLFILCERSNWNPNCIAGQRYLRAFLLTPPRLETYRRRT